MPRQLVKPRHKIVTPKRHEACRTTPNSYHMKLVIRCARRSVHNSVKLLTSSDKQRVLNEYDRLRKSIDLTFESNDPEK